MHWFVISYYYTKRHHVQRTLLFRPSIQAPAHHLAMVKVIKYWLCTHRAAHGVNAQNRLSWLSRVLILSQIIFLGYICNVLSVQWLCRCFPWPTHSIWIHDPCDHHCQLYCTGTGATSASLWQDAHVSTTGKHVPFTVICIIFQLLLCLFYFLLRRLDGFEQWWIEPQVRSLLHTF